MTQPQAVNKYNVRAFTPEDHKTVATWWTAQKWPVIPMDLLPTGIVVEYEGAPVAMGWLYKSNSKMAYMEWLVADPLADKTVKGTCLDILVQAIISEAKKDGYTTIFTNTSHPKLIERYTNMGFKVTEGNMTNLVRRI